jgi:hypothetical protein
MWKTPRRLFLDAFILGWGFSAFVMCAVMDLYGQDRWLDVVRYHWADSRWTMPLEIVVLVTLGFVVVHKFRSLPKRLVDADEKTPPPTRGADPPGSTGASGT